MGTDYDIIVVGGGHAGIEAAHAGWKMGLKVALLTMNPKTIGKMPGNPAIGGVGKGQIVRDIDALGGLMGKLADRAGIQFRMLNESKGPAVWGPRCQTDMYLYEQLAQETMESLDGLNILAGEVLSLEADGGFWRIKLASNQSFSARAVVLTAGTFLDSKMFIGREKSIGGRIGETSATALSKSLVKLGLALKRFQTGTPPRLDPKSIDYRKCEVQKGDEQPQTFSSSTDPKTLTNKAVCWITRTNEQTHKILRQGFAESPLFNGEIKGTGPRYCPTIEEKITRFSERSSHQLFLEPESLSGGSIYVNGFFSSLSAETQLNALRTVPGLENCEVDFYGYGVEYDGIDATQLHPSLQSKKHAGLWFAGQVCGTSGYEEAAGQGIIAGINAALYVQKKAPWVPGRSESYVGVMLDDLTSIELIEPYRMFTSRAEYRLFLRHDNAAQRLSPKARELGMLNDSEWHAFEQSQERIVAVRHWLEQNSPTSEQVELLLRDSGQNPPQDRLKWMSFMRRPGVSLSKIKQLVQSEHISQLKFSLKDIEWLHIYAQELYSGFYERQKRDIEQQRKMESFPLSADFDYNQVDSLSAESKQRLLAMRPLTLGQAARIAGVRPTDIHILMRWFNRE